MSSDIYNEVEKVLCYITSTKTGPEEKSLKKRKKYINIINKQKLSYNCYVVSMNNETSTPFRQCFTIAMLCPWIMKHKLHLDINSQKIYHVSVTNNMYTFFSQPNPIITSDIFWMAEIQYLSFIHLEEIQCQSQINIQSSNNWQSFWFNNKDFTKCALYVYVGVHIYLPKVVLS